MAKNRRSAARIANLLTLPELPLFEEAANASFSLFVPCLAKCCTAEVLVLCYVARPANVRFPFHLAERDSDRSLLVAPPKIHLLQNLTSYSPNRRSHEVWRISTLRDHFRATWRGAG